MHAAVGAVVGKPKLCYTKSMKRRLVQFLLLLSLFFNVAHASIIAVEDKAHGCHHQSASAYLAEQSHSDACGDLCDLHPLFHFVAIVITHDLAMAIPIPLKIAPSTKPALAGAIAEESFKPPIA